jgi:hypothetical protein
MKLLERRNKNDWWDAGREGMLKQKNEARGKWEVRNTRASTELYLQKRKETRKYFKGKKKQWLQRKVEEMEQARRKNDIRKFCKDMTICTCLTSKNIMIIK